MSTKVIDITYKEGGDLAGRRRRRAEADAAARERDISCSRTVRPAKAACRFRASLPSVASTTSRPQRSPQPRRPRRRVRRPARGPPPRDARRLRRRRGQPLPRLPDHRGPGRRPGRRGPGEAIDAYVHALEDGLLKTMAKMGISTVESYRGAQIFEAVGLESDFVAEYFEGTEIRTEGIGLDVIEEDLHPRHDAASSAEPEARTTGRVREPLGRHPPRLEPPDRRHAPAVRPRRRLREVQGVRGAGQRPVEELQALRGLLEFDSDREPSPSRTSSRSTTSSSASRPRRCRSGRYRPRRTRTTPSQ